MPIKIRCAACGKGLNAPDKLAGRSAACPACGAKVEVPAFSIVEGEAPNKNVGKVANKVAPNSDRNVPAADSARKAAAREVGKEPAKRTAEKAPDPEDSDTYALAGPPPPSAAIIARPIVGPSRSHLDGAHSSAVIPKKRAASREPTFAEALGSFRPRLLRGYWLLALALVPLAVSMTTGPDDTVDRLISTIEEHPEIIKDLDEDPTRSDVFEAVGRLPGGKIEGAHLSRNTWVHWIYALLAAGLFLGVVAPLFEWGETPFWHLPAVAFGTATGGVLFLICLQWIAMFGLNIRLIGRGWIIVIVLVLKLIAFSYYATEMDVGFTLSLLGFTFGVGLCEEFSKALPLMFHFRSEGTLGWREACLWGLASGIGFGVAEGIMYSSDYYNGLAGGGIYVVRFISCVALHAVWSAAVGIMIFRHRGFFAEDWEWKELAVATLLVLAVPMTLHGLYDTALKMEMNPLALGAAVASIVWLGLVIEWTRHQEALFLGESPKVAPSTA